VINTTTDRRPISQRDLDELALLAPHLRRAVTIGDLFELQMAETGLYRSIVDNLNCAVLIVTANMRLLYANRLGESLLQAGILCRCPSSMVTFVNPLVQTCVAGTIATGQRSEVALGGRGIGMPLVPVACPSVAHILPLGGRSGFGQFQKDAAAAIFIAAPLATPVTAIEAIASLFGLTTAEKRVAGMIANGMSRAEIALSCGTTAGTVKSQLDAIFDKTQTGSQRELEKLLRDLTPPLKQG
jgi:DNA-binding CsgD family transcriptional regulator